MKIPHRLPSSIRKREEGGIDRGGGGEQRSRGPTEAPFKKLKAKIYMLWFDQLFVKE